MKTLLLAMTLAVGLFAAFLTGQRQAARSLAAEINSSIIKEGRISIVAIYKDGSYEVRPLYENVADAQRALAR